MRNLVFNILLLVILLASCVPAKKLVYLQEGDELSKRKEIVTDSVVRTHDLQVKEYRIQPLDVLQIRFETITDEEFNFFRVSTQVGSGNNNANQNNLNGILVDTEGNVEFAVLGKVKLSGLTVFEAQELLQGMANKYLKDVVVRIRMLNFRFTILGADERVVVSNNTRITLMEAIAMGGGVGELSDRSRVKIIRQVDDDTAEVFFVNLLEEDFIESEFYYVQQNDIIIVPPLKQRTFRQYFTQNLAIIVSTTTSILLLINIFTR